MARKIQEINAGSMADIAFLLLIFFLVTTTMDVDMGIIRKLPQPLPPDVKPEKINERNVFQVLVNSADMLLVNGKRTNIKNLRLDAKDFLKARPMEEPAGYPQNKIEEIDLLGPTWKSKGVISLQNDRGTSYDMYIQVQNELAAAVRELRDEMSQQKFGKKFADLDVEKSKAISKAIPVAISEAEPKKLGQNTGG
jgi:biopolymer transport protein ExbD